MRNKFLLLLSLVILALNSYSQTHLTFKGIPINGKATDFVNTLIGQGYKFSSKTEKITSLNGDFAGYKNCEISVVSSATTGIVWKVVVYLPKKESWSIIKSEYNAFKTILLNKYGDAKSNEYFLSPYEEYDGYEMQAVKLEKAIFYTYWLLSEGFVSVEISRFQQVRISYEDRINSAIDDKERNNQINKDI